MRVKRGTTTNRRHKKLLKAAKGFRGGRSKLYKQARQATIHAGADAYRGRKGKKREMRSLWITRINGALSQHNISYSQFIGKLKSKKINLDRKILSQIAIEDPKAFDEIVKKTGISSQILGSTLSMLEVKGIIKNAGSGFYNLIH